MATQAPAENKNSKLSPSEAGQAGGSRRNSMEETMAAKRRASLQYQQKKFNPQESESFAKLSKEHAKASKRKTFGGDTHHDCP